MGSGLIPDDLELRIIRLRALDVGLTSQESNS